MTYKLGEGETTYFYKESALFPSVNFAEGKKGYVLSNEGYTDILIYVEQNEFIHV